MLQISRPRSKCQRAAAAAVCVLIAGEALAALALPAAAQTELPTGPAPSGTAPGATDVQFFGKAAQDSAFQLACAELAIENSLSPDIQQLGTQIVQDHAQTNLMVLGFAHDHAFSVPVSLSASDAKEVKTLSALHGSAFDLAYAQEVTTTHAQEAEAADVEIANTLYQPAQTLATLMRDTLRHHLAAANLVAQKLGVPPQKEITPRTGLPLG